MYSGNHSPCHPLDTLLEAALRLRSQADLAFYFVGGGSEQVKVKAFAENHDLKNVQCLPYQSRSDLSGSLSAADLHVIVMGDPFVGIVHPCKVYNILQIGAPFLYIGPSESHLTDIILQMEGGQIYSARHGAVDSVVEAILEASRKQNLSRAKYLAQRYRQATLLPAMIEALEGSGAETTKELSKDYQTVATPLTSDN
jgi:hypothetical protein